MKILALVLFCLNIIFAAISSAAIVFGTDNSAKMLNAAAVLINALSAVNLYTKFLM